MIHDFQHHYHLNLVDLVRPGSGYSPRLVMTLARKLPPESTTIAAQRGGEHFEGWSLDRYMAAALIDAIHENTYAFVCAHSKKRPPLPEPMYRPDNDRQTKKKNNLFAAMAAQRIEAVRKSRGG